MEKNGMIIFLESQLRRATLNINIHLQKLNERIDKQISNELKLKS